MGNKRRYRNEDAIAIEDQQMEGAESELAGDYGESYEHEAKEISMMHEIHKDVDEIKMKMKGDYDMNYGATISPVGNIGGYGGGYGGYGYGGGCLEGILLATLLGHRGFDGKDGCCDKDRTLVVEALKGNIDACKEVAKCCEVDIDAVRSALCCVKAEVEKNGAKIDCVQHTEEQILHVVDNIKDKLCHSELINVKEFGEIKYRDLQNTMEIKDYSRNLNETLAANMNARFNKVDCKLEHIDHEMERHFCKLEKAALEKEIRELREDRDGWKRAKENGDTTQIIGSTITNTITSLLSGNSAN